MSNKTNDFMKGEIKKQLMLVFTVIGGILIFSNHAQAQDSVSYRSNTTQTTTTTSSSDTYSDDYDDDGRDETTDVASPRAGIKAGLNMSNLIVDDVNDRNARFGFHAGVYGQLFSSQAFALQPEVNFSTKGNKADYNVGVIQQETKLNLSYIDIPILAVFKLGRAAEIHAGAYWAYLVGANIDTDGDLGDDFRRVDRENFDDWDYGLVGGLGFNLGEGAQLGARYSYGLNEIAESRGAKAMLGDTKNSVAQIYLAFNLAAGN
ncbi:MAG TPA: porin family protein [Ohtaekwangia sp.]|nr:porin family protein [Ohtaekwangia sp.]